MKKQKTGINESPYCCLTCYSKFTYRDIVKTEFFGYACPCCKSPQIHPVNGEEITLDVYYGEIGTLN